jgi:serine/threonine protein phosphatase PrpC
MKFCSYSTTHVGRSSTSNQDVLLIDKELSAYILCDGMGGTAGGSTAATLAAQAALDYLREHAATIANISNSTSDPRSLVTLAEAALLAANEKVYTYSQQHSDLRGSGTTLSLLITSGNSGVCAHVGDSQVFLVRDKKLLQLTKDHSLAQDLIDRGKLDKSQLQSFPFRHILSRAIGIQASVTVDTLPLEILPGDRFLLVTGGLSTRIGCTSLQVLLSNDDPQRIPETLVSVARESPDDESLSAIVVEAIANKDEYNEQIARAAEVLLRTNVLNEVSLFQELDSQSILRLVDASTVVECLEGSTLVRQGEVEASLYVILDGSFDVIVDNHPLARLTRGNHFGEMALLTNQPRSASICARTDGKALRITSEAFQRFIAEYPQEGVRMMTALARELSDRLRSTNLLHTPNAMKIQQS